MKKVLFLAVGLLAISCEQNDHDLFKTFDDYTYVGFTNGNAVVSTAENSGTYEIPVLISAAQDQDVVVTLTTTDGTAVAGQHFSLASSTVTIPAGQYGGTFVLNLIDDEDFNESRTFEIGLSTNVPNLRIGLDGATGTFEKTVLIVNDDCPTNFNIWFGSILVEDVGFGNTPGVGSANASGTCDVLVVDNNMPGIGSATNTIYEVVLVPDFDGATTGTATVANTTARTGIANAQFGPLSAVYEASGFYDEDSATITLEYVLKAVNAGGSTVGNFYTGTNVITKP